MAWFASLDATGSKAAQAICDDLISTTIVACQAPIVFVPSMNKAMWADKLVQRNVNILKEVGYYFLESGEGYEVSDMEKGGQGDTAHGQPISQLESDFGCSRRRGSTLIVLHITAFVMRLQNGPAGSTKDRGGA